MMKAALVLWTARPKIVAQPLKRSTRHSRSPSWRRPNRAAAISVPAAMPMTRPRLFWVNQSSVACHRSIDLAPISVRPAGRVGVVMVRSFSASASWV
jgi:hypothetical protein